MCSKTSAVMLPKTSSAGTVFEALSHYVHAQTGVEINAEQMVDIFAKQSINLTALTEISLTAPSVKINSTDDKWFTETSLHSYGLKVTGGGVNHSSWMTNTGFHGLHLTEAKIKKKSNGVTINGDLTVIQQSLTINQMATLISIM